MKHVLVFMTGMALVLSGITSSGADARTHSTSDDRDAETIATIRAVLDMQVAAWNRGDIEGFMSGYWRSPETVFISGDTVTHGWQTVLDRYKKGYPTREKMGMLTFSDLEIKLISKDAAVANGRWQLARSGDTPHGRFTLIFRKTKEGWRIVHDHTSSA
jgi:ketosteroid isomerase-like protein